MIEKVNAYSLAVDLIPKRGVPKLQARNARALARKAFNRTNRRKRFRILIRA